jgi:hypothetical protein
MEGTVGIDHGKSSHRYRLGGVRFPYIARQQRFRIGGFPGNSHPESVTLQKVATKPWRERSAQTDTQAARSGQRRRGAAPG